MPLGQIESVADHSFAVAIMAMVESDQRGLDVRKAITLALIHDLEEAIMGDLTPAQKKRKGVEWVSESRDQAISMILSRLRSDRRGYYVKLWKDLRRNRSREAKLVRDLDKLEMALQAREYSKKVTGGDWSDFYASANRAIKDEKFARIMKNLERY